MVMDPKTGAILAMASSPTYSASDFEAALAAGDSSSVLLNRATQSLYPPGSTFKIVTLGAALENNIATEDSIYASPGEMTIGNGPVTNYDGNSMGDVSLRTATVWSSNTVFGQVGVQMGPELLVSSSEKFGFNSEIKFDLPLAKSLMPNPEEMTEWETAWSAVGQPVGQHESPAGPQVTVLQMAMVGSAVANGGDVPTPYIVESVSNADGTNSYTATPTRYSQAISATTADRVKDVLEDVVSRGTGVAASISGVQVAGKTGTAETGKAVDDTWFVGLAPSDNPSVVVAIVLEEGADDTEAAAKAQNVLKTALEVQGLL